MAHSFTPMNTGSSVHGFICKKCLKLEADTVHTDALANQLVVRVSRHLKDALERDASQNGRTLAQSVRFHLRRALQP